MGPRILVLPTASPPHFAGGKSEVTEGHCPCFPLPQAAGGSAAEGLVRPDPRDQALHEPSSCPIAHESPLGPHPGRDGQMPGVARGPEGSFPGWPQGLHMPPAVLAGPLRFPRPQPLCLSCSKPPACGPSPRLFSPQGCEFSVTTFPDSFGAVGPGFGACEGSWVEAKGRVFYDLSSFNFSQNHCRPWSQCDSGPGGTERWSQDR